MIPEELKNYLPFWVVFALAIYGLVVAITKSLEFLFNFLPTLKGKTLDKFAEWTKSKKIIKAAESANIENAVNSTVLEFQSEFPIGWIKKAKLNWVSNLSSHDIHEGEVILRLKPSRFQDENFTAAIYFLFKQILFPDLKEVIPSNIQEATSLQVSHRAIEEKHPYLLATFEKGFMEPNIQRDNSIVTYLEKYSIIDKKGFFTGIFIRELNEIATRARFKSLRNNLDQEAQHLLNHMQEFVTRYESKSEEEILSDDYWYRKGPATSYAIILVAQPYKQRWQGTKPYINRVQKWIDQGIERLYIMGAEKQRSFVEDVINSVTKKPELELVEIFSPHRDYRGKKGGLCALFTIRPNHGR